MQIGLKQSNGLQLSYDASELLSHCCADLFAFVSIAHQCRLNFYRAGIDAYVVVEIQKPAKPSAALWWIGILIIVVGILVAANSIGSSGGVPTNLELASAICCASLLLGMIPIGYYLILENKHYVVTEKETDTIVMKHGIDLPPKVSFIPLFVSCFLLFGSFTANWMLGDKESNFLCLSGMLLLIYFLVLVINRENKVKRLSEEMAISEDM